MEFNNLKIERRGHIAIVTLNRPEKLNALNLDTMEEIEALGPEFRRDADTRAIVFAGAGKHFTAGADLNDARRKERMDAPLTLRRRMITIGMRATRALLELDQITIAAIHGGALGGGVVFASALDFRIGAEDCFAGLPEIDRGMNMSWVGLPLIVHLIGPARAKRLAILGYRENAQTLREWGWLDEVVPAGKLLDRAIELATAYAAKPPAQAQMIKRSVNVIAGALDQAVMHMDADQWLLAAQTEDAAEAMRAFFEKRDPEFTGN